MFLADTQINTTIQQSSDVLKQITGSTFNVRSVIVLVLSLTVAILLGRLVAAIMRRITGIVSRRADKTENLNTVNRLRRIETMIVLSIALVRALLVVVALYFWWVFIHPHQQPGAIIGASALFALILTGMSSPILQDIARGSAMMAEHWYGVGDHITIMPATMGIQGVVERVTLRSTKIRALSGEAIWMSNQSITGVSITPRGTRTIALEIFVTDPDKGAALVEQTNLRLSTGWLTVINPLAVMTTSKVADNLWHITAICEVARGREWLIEEHGIRVMTELDERRRHPILVHRPIVRYTDSEAEKRFTRTIKNARKQKPKRTLTTRARPYKIRKVQ